MITKYNLFENKSLDLIYQYIPGNPDGIPIDMLENAVGTKIII